MGFTAFPSFMALSVVQSSLNTTMMNSRRSRSYGSSFSDYPYSEPEYSESCDCGLCLDSDEDDSNQPTTKSNPEAPIRVSSASWTGRHQKD